MLHVLRMVDAFITAIAAIVLLTELTTGSVSSTWETLKEEMKSSQIFADICLKLFEGLHSVSVYLFQRSDNTKFWKVYDSTLHKILKVVALVKSSVFDENDIMNSSQKEDVSILILAEKGHQEFSHSPYSSDFNVSCSFHSRAVFVHSSLTTNLSDEFGLKASEFVKSVCPVLDLSIITIVFFCEGVQKGCIQIATYNPALNKIVNRFEDNEVKNFVTVKSKFLNLYGRTVGVVTDFTDVMIQDCLSSEGQSCDFRLSRDYYFLKELRTRMNFTPKLMKSSDGVPESFVFRNGTVVGPAADLVGGRADMILSAEPLAHFPQGMVDFVSPTVNVGYLCIIVPKPGLLPIWKAFYLCFTKEFLVCVTAMVGLCSVVWSALTGRRPKDFLFCLSQVILLLSSIPLHNFYNIPGTGLRGLRLRVFAALLVFIGVVLAVIVQASLMSLYNTPLREQQITSLQDLADSSLEIGVPEYYWGIVLGDGESWFKGFQNKLFKVKDISLKTHISDDANVALLVTSVSLGSDRNLRYIVNIRFQFLSECPKLYFISYKVSYRSPLLESVNEMAGRWLESGFYERHYRTLKDRGCLKAEKTPRRLVISDFAVGGVVLGIGLSLSALVFLGELQINIFRH